MGEIIPMVFKSPVAHSWCSWLQSPKMQASSLCTGFHGHIFRKFCKSLTQVCNMKTINFDCLVAAFHWQALNGMPPPLCGKHVAQFSLQSKGWWQEGHPTVKTKMP